MALIDSKQLNPRLTGSFSLSGSLSGVDIIPAEAIEGQLGIFSPTGSIQSTHNFFDNLISLFLSMKIQHLSFWFPLRQCVFQKHWLLKKVKV